MRWHRSVCVLAGLLLATAMAAAGEPPSKPFDISTPQSFHEQATQVRAGMQPGEVYAFLSTQDRTGRVANVVEI